MSEWRARLSELAEDWEHLPSGEYAEESQVGQDIRAALDRIAALEAEVERLRELNHQVIQDEIEWREKAASRLEEVERLRARAENAHLLCSAYPVTCPDCGYKWKSGLLSLAAALRGEGEKCSLGQCEVCGGPKNLNDALVAGWDLEEGAK